MESLMKINREIRNLRKHIHDLIDEKGNLLDPEILSASKCLDNLLNEYVKILDNKL